MEPQPRADLNDDGNFRNGGNFRNVRNDRNGENVRNVRNVSTYIKCHNFSETQARAYLTDDGNFMNDGAVRNVGNVRKVGNVRHIENVRNVLLYTTKPYHTKYHQISNNNKSTNFQPVADIVLLYLFLTVC